jgi:EAL domain-containing protein (putative c-di-GMP-specific phosphodiesterase class I)
VLGYEALTRFGDGTAPDRMFEDARSCDMGVPLEVATIVAALDAAGPLPANRFIDLNVSPELVMAEEPLRTYLRQRGFNIVLEITEHTAIEDYPALRAAFASLGDNVQVAVDDAGAGYASLRHITELRPQFVKLDRELIRGIDGDLIRQALITGMVHFSDGVGSLLIAEGVETEDERATLLALGVKAAQGYLFARPQSAELVPK